MSSVGSAAVAPAPRTAVAASAPVESTPDGESARIPSPVRRLAPISSKSRPCCSVLVSLKPPDMPTPRRSEEHTSELQSLMRISYAVFCSKKKSKTISLSHQQYSTQLYYQTTP